MGMDKQHMQDENRQLLSTANCACRVLLEAMSEGALVLTSEGTILYCNQSFANMLQRAASQVRGRAIFDFMADLDIKHFKQLLGQSALNKRIEVSLISGDSQKIPALFSMYTNEDLEEEDQLSVYAVVKNLSDISKAETALDVRADQLEASNRDLESFFSSASHELRAPLRHITSFTELLSDHLNHSLDNTSSHYLDVISNSATEMNTLIDNLLDWARVGSAAVNLSRVDLNLLVSSVINSFELGITGRDIEWDIGNLPDVSGDLNMLRTAFVCLISNAVKFTRLQPVARIKIAHEPGLSDSNCIVVSIKDNGIGFDRQYKEKIFSLLQRMHNYEEFEGNGIGLATVKRVAQRHGGHVWADSEQGKGTVIYLKLGKYGQES